jgi:hypothetical protein
MSNVALSALAVGGSTQIFELWDEEKLQCSIIHSVVKVGKAGQQQWATPHLYSILCYTLFMGTRTEEGLASIALSHFIW